MKCLLCFIIIIAVVIHHNKVEGKCGCPSIGGKVCGTNGVTYKNECRLKCAAATLPGLMVAAYTTCARHGHPCVCANDYRPVCGTDGITYKNQCEILCANTRDGKKRLNVEYVGDCTSDRAKQLQNRILTLISPYGKELAFDTDNTTGGNSTSNISNTTTPKSSNALYNIFHENEDSGQGNNVSSDPSSSKVQSIDKQEGTASQSNTSKLLPPSANNESHEAADVTTAAQAASASDIPNIFHEK